MTEPGARPTVDNAEYMEMLARMIRAAGRRLSNGDLASLASLAALRAELDAAIDSAVTVLHEHYSWTEIGAALGTTRQNAWQRYGKP